MLRTPATGSTGSTGSSPPRHRLHLVTGSAWSGGDALRRIDLVLTFAIAASLFDVVSTWYALDSARHSEQNPVMSALIDHLGLVPVLAIDLVVRIGIACALAAIARRAARPLVRYTATVTMVAVTIWWCAIVFANAVVIGRAL